MWPTLGYKVNANEEKATTRRIIDRFWCVRFKSDALTQLGLDGERSDQGTASTCKLYDGCKPHSFIIISLNARATRTVVAAVHRGHNAMRSASVLLIDQCFNFAASLAQTHIYSVNVIKWNGITVAEQKNCRKCVSRKMERKNQSNATIELKLSWGGWLWLLQNVRCPQLQNTIGT